MDKIEFEIRKINLEIDGIVCLLKKSFNDWTEKEKKEFGNHQKLRQIKMQLRDIKLVHLKQKNLSSLRDQSSLTAETTALTLKQILKNLLEFDFENFQANFSRPLVTLNEIPTDETSYIIPLMKFVCREEPTRALYNTLDDYLDWKVKNVGDPEKNFKFITVVGTSGKQRLPVVSLSFHIPESTLFFINRDAETQLSSLILYEAFKDYDRTSKGWTKFDDYIDGFRNDFQKRLLLDDVLQLITETFGFESIQKRLLIINLDATSTLLRYDPQKLFFQKLLRLLRNASKKFMLLTILSGTRSVDLLDQVQISQYQFTNIELSLIGLDAAKDVILVLGMTANPSKHNISPYLDCILTLCGGVGSYLEITIIQMSILGAYAMNQSTIKEFRLEACEYFLDHLQDSSLEIKALLKKVMAKVIFCYSFVFESYAKSIEILSCYTLFQWNVERSTIIDGYTVADMENERILFLQYVPETKQYTCTVPFITLYWAITYSNNNISIPFLKYLKCNSNSCESEIIFLNIMTAKLWGLCRKDNRRLDIMGNCTVQLSELVPLRVGQPDMNIKFRPIFTIFKGAKQIQDRKKWFQRLTKYIAHINPKGASIVNSVIDSWPRIVIQEKQGILDKKQNVNGFQSSTFSDDAFKVERRYFFENYVKIHVTDEKAGKTDLGKRDVIIDCFAFASPLLALRKLFSLTELSKSEKQTVIRMSDLLQNQSQKSFFAHG